MYPDEQRRIHFPQAETSAEFFDLPSKRRDKSLPHPPEIRFSSLKSQKSKNEENKSKNELS